MARNEPINVTVNLSQRDRELLKMMVRGLGIDPNDEKSFTDAVQSFDAEKQVAHIRRLIERPVPSDEGDWLLETERVEAGDDVD
jgi:hypothetical protein